MLPGQPGGGRTPEGVGPRVNDTRRGAGAEIGRESHSAVALEDSRQKLWTGLMMKLRNAPKEYPLTREPRGTSPQSAAQSNSIERHGQYAVLAVGAPTHP
jgi:hypothetical protein